MNTKASKSRNVKALRRMVANLEKKTETRLKNAVCDVIDLGGFSLAVLLEKLSSLTVPVQMVAARKIEDFLYFHPEKGAKLFDRLLAAMRDVDVTCRPFLLAALADVVSHVEADHMTIGKLAPDALDALDSDMDFVRMGRAVELVVKATGITGIPAIIRLMIKSTSRLDDYANYQFIETALMALKRLGGEPVIRLLINPASDEAIRQLRMEWRSMDQQLLQDTLAALRQVDADFAQVMLKVIDLSDFNLPFAAMIREGISHSDKWVRHAAVASMKKASEAVSPEALARMLNDDSSEVRLMAVTSLGGFAREQTGVTLEELAARQGESLEIRLNALYALFSQKNLPALENLVTSVDNFNLAVNAQGLASLLMPREEGAKNMLKTFVSVKSELVTEAGYYLLEILEPEDIEILISAHASAANEVQRERLIDFLRLFVAKKAGPRFDQARARLSVAEQKALDLLSPPKAPLKAKLQSS
ncbi:MAG: HEAT repeat domain-containing protein [Candidatus Riflebacteria bacterium]|nr:HEAT repeat domain-containing protein [Candidatus Riflebacteria bacterium]